MQEELRRSNSIGNPEGVDTFLSLIFAQRLSSVKALNHACRFLLFYQLNCRLALLLLEDLGLIRVTKDCITVLTAGERFFELSQAFHPSPKPQDFFFHLRQLVLEFLSLATHSLGCLHFKHTKITIGN